VVFTDREAVAKCLQSGFNRCVSYREGGFNMYISINMVGLIGFNRS
jgi:hypothetical protein